jgi:uncharacterized RDD family membrane protein YckC
MVAPAVHGALAPDSRTLPARARGEAAREIPGLRRREKNWQDEVRDRVRKRKKKRGDGAELPLFESEGSAAPDVVPEPGPFSAAPVPEPTPDPPPLAPREWVAPPRDERTPSFEGRILDRVDPLDSLTDLPLRPPEVMVPSVAPRTEASDLLAEFEAPPEGSADQLERGPGRRTGLAREFEAPPEGSADQLERGPGRRTGLAREFEAPPEGSADQLERGPGRRTGLAREFEAPPEGSADQLERGPGRRTGLAREFEAPPKGSAEAPEHDGWSVDAPLELRLEPRPQLVDEAPVERPAQALERAQAAAVDAVLLAGLFSVVVYFASRSAHVSIDGLRPSWPYLGAYLCFLALVYAVYFTGTTGQTLGKIVYGLRVVDTAGRPPGYLRAAGRAALGALGVGLAGLGLLPVIFDPARRAFHDRVLHTRVIRG